jgi:hypothetical protein
MKLGALTLGAYRLIIVISFWCISLFISVECPSLSHLINVGLKSTLSEISISTPAYFGTIGLVNLLAFHSQPVLVSVDEMVSFRQQIIGSSLLIQFASQCLFIGEFSPLIFSVSIDKY